MDYEQHLRQLLEEIEIYRPTDEVFAITHEDAEAKESLALCGYNTNHEDPVAAFDFQLVIPRYCYILHMTVRLDHRRQGIATKLVGCIEKLTLAHGVKRLIVTPAGEGHLFWPAVGFVPNPESSLSLIKMLSDN